ncbi:hypothetical protein CEE37_14345 [candidate division LCP-89 bacterium B3_LCP]|uniref:PepSY domain-containing protein n=1 Tax=candidate division LCP-89 bacterium B3_LCP TaxID=2012998 RepID=A0A532UQR4_UNCL8|nr:MAG: hypothetical protein CEE37_14345 [candidate division LCP-89 bacterium B3_LCP]
MDGIIDVYLSPELNLALILDEDDGYLTYEVIVVTPARAIMELDIDAGTGALMEMEEWECCEEEDD